MNRRAPAARASSANRVRGADRFAARSRRRRLGKVLQTLAALIAATGLTWLVWLVGWSELTALETVRVNGADGRLATDVVDAAAAPLGLQLIRVDTDAIEERVRSVADIEEVSVRLSWLRSLSIEVTERQPAAAIETRGSWWLVDAEGVLFGESSAQPVELPVLEAAVGTSEEDVAARVAGAAVLAGLPDALRDRIVTVAASSAGGVELRLDEEITVVWGTADDADRKAEVLEALLAAEDGSRYDVSAPDFPAVTP